MDLAAIDAKLRARRALPSPAVARAVRLDAGLSQDDVASALGVTRAAVARWEAGTRHPRGRNLIDYAELLSRLRQADAA